jgi:RNA polymerase-binding protein DksA
MKNDRLKKKEIENFKTVLINRKNRILGNVSQMQGEVLKHSRQDSSGDLSTIPFHLADIGTDNYEQEFTLGLIENEEEELKEIDTALDKIDRGTFGLCEECQASIPHERLRAIPYARLCAVCKQKEEKKVEK